MLGDTKKVLKGFQEAGYQVIEAEIKLESEDIKGSKKGSKSRSQNEIGWRVLTDDSQCVGVVIPTPAPRRILGKMVCFGEPWFHIEPDVTQQECGMEAVHTAARILGAVGRGGMYHDGKVWLAASGNGVGSILGNGNSKGSH